MDYYEISYSTDLDQMGSLPQISYFEIEGKQRPYDDVITFHSFAGEGLVFKGNLKTAAKFTDLMVCPGLSTGKGLLVSDRFNNILSACNLPGCTPYDFTISGETATLAYHYLHIQFCYQIKQQLNYAASVFYTGNDGEKQPVQVDSWESWWDKNLLNVQNNQNIIGVEKLLFTGPQKNIPGVIRLPFSAKIYISALVKKWVEDNKLTGIVIGAKEFEILAD